LIEAQITGGLEHPGIVPVYGLGAYGDGRPYYAMRFVRGDSLKEAIDHFHVASKAGPGPAGSRDLALRKLLRRFLDVCNAIDYAHARGVIHRDIKPANIIVGQHGETLVVDWGLAKPTGRVGPGTDSGERVLMPCSASGSPETLPGSALGTPAYMSPEQAEGQLDRLGPRSDVYSLGATLYCLLIGKPPFAGDVADVIRAVQRGEFPPPRQLDPSLDPALEAICLQAMAHRPEDRYSSCQALADDLDRWLAAEPVTAWREPLARRARRWAKRNRTAVTAAAVALVAGVAGLTAVLAVQTRANAELTRSQAAVLARYDLAVAAIKTFHTGVSEDFLLKQDQFKEVRDRLLKSASDFYGKLGALLGQESDLASRQAVWQANYEVAELTGKVGKRENALAAHRQVLAAREALAAETPADSEIKVDVGRSLTAVAIFLEATGRTKEAEAMYRQAETLLVELAPATMEATAARAVLANCRSRLGGFLYNTGRIDEALSVYGLARADQEALVSVPGATAESRLELAGTINRVAILLAATGQSSAAEAEYRQALALHEKLVEGNPAVTDFRSRLAMTHYNLAFLLSSTGKSSAAEAEARKALALYQKLADDNPAIPQFQRDLADSLIPFGWQLAQAGKTDEAIGYYAREEAIRQKLAEGSSATPEDSDRLANCLTNTADLLRRSGRLHEALAACQRSLAVRQPLVEAHPELSGYRARLGETYVRLGQVRSDMEDLAGAAAAWKRACAHYVASQSLNGQHTFFLAFCHAGLAALAGRPGSGVSAAEGADQAETAMAVLRQAVTLGYRNPAAYRTESALDPLRNRPDFRSLMMDLVFPTKPFAP
jgi:serine/threonine-protein kinase